MEHFINCIHNSSFNLQFCQIYALEKKEREKEKEKKGREKMSIIYCTAMGNLAILSTSFNVGTDFTYPLPNNFRFRMLQFIKYFKMLFSWKEANLISKFWVTEQSNAEFTSSRYFLLRFLVWNLFKVIT